MRERRFIFARPLLRGYSETKPWKQGFETFRHFRVALDFQQNNAGRFRTVPSWRDKKELFENQMRGDIIR